MSGWRIVSLESRSVNRHGSKPLKEERLIFCDGFAHILIVYFPICLSFLSFFFQTPRGRETKGFFDSLANAKK